MVHKFTEQFLFRMQVVERSSLVSVLLEIHLLVNCFSVTCVPLFKKNLNDKYRYCCLNYILALPQCLHNTMINTQNLLQFSLKCHPIHPGIHKDPTIGAQT